MGEQLLGPSSLLEGLATIITDDEANKRAFRNAHSEIRGTGPNDLSVHECGSALGAVL